MKLILPSPGATRGRTPEPRSLWGARQMAVSALLLMATSLAGQTAELRLDDCDFHRTFTENFDDFHVSAWRYDGRGWTSHTPWAGDFGNAQFSDPQPTFPFTVRAHELQIEARRDASGKWASGLLASTDASTVGFSQQYGYFEIDTKLPQGDGLWPAFWLATNKLKESKESAVELDVFEHYGLAPSIFHSVVHVWRQPPEESTAIDHVVYVEPGSLYSSYHTYGVSVEPDFLRFYFDRKVTWQIETPPELRKPLLILVNLALGGGWPINKAPSPSYMLVRYIHVYSKDSSDCVMKKE